MERDDLIEYSLHAHHDEAKGKEIRSKIYKVTLLLTIVTIIEVFIGSSIKQSSDWWAAVKITFILLTLLKAGYSVMVFPKNLPKDFLESFQGNSWEVLLIKSLVG